jgi:hypothetical protein
MELRFKPLAESRENILRLQRQHFAVFFPSATLTNFSLASTSGLCDMAATIVSALSSAGKKGRL